MKTAKFTLLLLVSLITSQAHAFPAVVICQSSASNALCEIPVGKSLILETQLGSCLRM